MRIITFILGTLLSFSAIASIDCNLRSFKNTVEGANNWEKTKANIKASIKDQLLKLNASYNEEDLKLKIRYWPDGDLSSGSGRYKMNVRLNNGTRLKSWGSIEREAKLEIGHDSLGNVNKRVCYLISTIHHMGIENVETGVELSIYERSSAVNRINLLP